MFSTCSMFLGDSCWQSLLVVGVWTWLWGRPRTPLHCCTCQTHSLDSWASETKYVLWEILHNPPLITLLLLKESRFFFCRNLTAVLTSYILQANSLTKQKLKRLYFTERCLGSFSYSHLHKTYSFLYCIKQSNLCWHVCMCVPVSTVSLMWQEQRSMNVRIWWDWYSFLVPLRDKWTWSQRLLTACQ